MSNRKVYAWEALIITICAALPAIEAGLRHKDTGLLLLLPALYQGLLALKAALTQSPAKPTDPPSIEAILALIASNPGAKTALTNALLRERGPQQP